jgi:anti-sigma factor RsiW
MTCARVRAQLQHYLDGMLSARAEARVETHLVGCPACRSAVEASQSAGRSAVQARYLQEPETLTRLVMARIAGWETRQTVARAERFSVGLADAFLAAALATVVTALFLAFQPGLRLLLATLVWNLALATQHEYFGLVSRWGPWVAWLMWTSIGVGLTLWFAGSELRAKWRRAVGERLPHL